MTEESPAIEQRDERSVQRADVLMVLTLREPNIVELWMRDGCGRHELAAELHKIADEFERGVIKKIG